jgi:hypothetical protein
MQKTKTLARLDSSEAVKQQDHSRIAGRNKNSIEVSYNTKYRFVIRSNNYNLRDFIQVSWKLIPTQILAPLFVAALVIITKIRNN